MAVANAKARHGDKGRPSCVASERSSYWTICFDGFLIIASNGIRLSYGYVQSIGQLVNEMKTRRKENNRKRNGGWKSSRLTGILIGGTADGLMN